MTHQELTDLLPKDKMIEQCEEAFEKMHEMSKGYSTTFYTITRDALDAIAKHKEQK